jgi:hypothetical protein
MHPTAGYNTPIPDAILTPDRVETRIGRLEFRDGFPTPETSALVYDHPDFLRGVEVFLNFLPAASLEAMRLGMVSLGATAAHQVVIMDRLLDSNPLFLTGNTDTVYVSGFLDLERDGPTVVEIPPGSGPGTVNDAFFRFVIDMGAPGPDRGRGGRYLILPEDYDGEVPDGYFVARSPSRVNWLILRGFLRDGRPDAAVASFTGGLRVYPLSTAGNPPAMEFLSGSGRVFNTIHANTSAFFEEVADVIAREPVGLIDPELRGLAASIGIRKDRPFAPDERMAGILADAAAVGNATARAIAFDTRDEAAFIYPDSAWKTAFIGGDHQWLIDGGRDGRDLDARSLFFYLATVNTPAMALKLVGLGSQYAYAERDRDGQYLDGSSTYRLTLPAGVPAKDFWSVVVYDPQTRSELRTSQPFPSRNSQRDALGVNPDGSTGLWFGPAAPSGHESNWIATVPGKGWFAILRLYGPLEPWFDQTWRPGEFERLRDGEV